MKEQKILIIAKYATTINEGFETRTCELAYNIASKGYEVSIITSDSNHLAVFPKYSKIYNQRIHLGVTFWWIKTLKYGNSGAFKRILSWIDFELKCFWLLFRKSKHDIIIVSSLSLLSILNGIIFKFLWRSKLIFEVRDIWPLTLICEGQFSKKNPFIIALDLIEKAGYKYANHIVGTMPNLLEHVQNQIGNSKINNISCIPFGIHREIAIINPKEESQQGIRKSKKFRVGYAGSIGITNALENLIETVCISYERKLDIEFVIIGDGSLKSKFENKTKKCDNVIFTGKIPRARVQDILSQCDVLFFSALPSEIWNYGWSPNKLIDYMMSERPIIAAYDGYRSMINEAECGFFIKAGCTDSILKELLRLKEINKNDLNEIGKRGKIWLLKNRTWEKLAEDYISIFNSIKPLR